MGKGVQFYILSLTNTGVDSNYSLYGLLIFLGASVIESQYEDK